MGVNVSTRYEIVRTAVRISNQSVRETVCGISYRIICNLITPEHIHGGIVVPGTAVVCALDEKEKGNEKKHAEGQK